MTDVYEFIGPSKNPSLIVLSEVRCVALLSPNEVQGTAEEVKALEEGMKGKLLLKVCYKGLPSFGTGGAACSSWLPEKEARRVYGDLKILIQRGTTP